MYIQQLLGDKFDMITIEVDKEADRDWNKRLTGSTLATTAQIKEMTFQKMQVYMIICQIY